MSKPPRIHIAYAEAMRALLDGPCTVKELCRVSGFSYETVNRFISSLRSEPRHIRIGGWERDSLGRASIQVFELSTAPDATKPKMQTGAQRTAVYKERKKRMAAAALHNVFRPIKEAA